MSYLEWAWTFVGVAVGAPTLVYVLARMATAAYFRSKREHDATTKGRCNHERP